MSSPAPVWDAINGFAAYWALHAAIDLGVFDALADRPLTTAQLATTTGVADPADLDALASLVAALGLLDTEGGEWALNDTARRFLVSSSPSSMTDLVRMSPGSHAAWPQLAATLRSGGPDAATLAATADLMPGLVQATAATQRAVATGVAAQLTWSERPVIVDLGCGSGAWLAALLDAAGPGARGVGVDVANVIDAVAAHLAMTAPSVELVAGDYIATPLPVDRADVVVLAHVLRAESEDRAAALVARALQLLAPGGTLLVADYFVPGPGQTAGEYRAARHDLTLAVTMRAGTAGRGIAEAQLAAWCADHGAATTAVVEPIPRQRVHLIHRPTGVHQ